MSKEKESRTIKVEEIADVIHAADEGMVGALFAACAMRLEDLLPPAEYWSATLGTLYTIFASSTTNSPPSKTGRTTQVRGRLLEKMDAQEAVGEYGD